MMSEMAGGTLERLRKGLRVFGFDGLNGNQINIFTGTHNAVLGSACSRKSWCGFPDINGLRQYKGQRPPKTKCCALQIPIDWTEGFDMTTDAEAFGTDIQP
jgi:hypothetical protein